MGVNHVGAAGAQQKMDALWRAVRRVAKQAFTHISVGRGGIRVYGGGEITFEQGGGIRILGDGYIDIDGDLTGAGDLSWTGPWNLSGLGTVTGDVAWSGDLNLTGDIVVTATGRIIAGAIIIDPSTSGGQIGFGADRRIHAGTGFLGIYDGSRFVVFNSSGVTLNGGSGSPTVTVGPTGLTISGLPSIESWAANGAVEGTLWQDTAGKVYRVIP